MGIILPMRISVWQLSTVVLLSVLIGQSLKTGPHEAEAASRDVFGSPQVAVSSYRNQKGSFILWADGHVSAIDAPDTVVSLLTDCVNAPEVPQVTRDNSKPQGSPNVPVGVYQNATATYVLFADGTTKKPKGNAAAPSANPSVRSAMIDGMAGNVEGDGSIKMRYTGSTGYYFVDFDPPFTKLPSVTVTSMSVPGVAGIKPATLSLTGCTVWTAVNGGFYNTPFCLTAVGE